MIPQLWTRNLEWNEWRQMHLNLSDREAEYLYQVEQRMFQYYMDDIIRQAQVRQAKLSGDLINLSAAISNILSPGRGLNKSIPEQNDQSTDIELITDEGFFLVTDEGFKLVVDQSSPNTDTELITDEGFSLITDEGHKLIGE